MRLWLSQLPQAVGQDKSMNSLWSQGEDGIRPKKMHAGTKHDWKLMIQKAEEEAVEVSFQMMYWQEIEKKKEAQPNMPEK